MIDYHNLIYEGHEVTFSIGGSIFASATKMAKAFGKLPSDWLRQKSTQEFISVVSSDTGIPISQLVLIKKGNNGQEQGTWLHKDVAMEFARWLSPKFGLWCNRRIEELLIHGRTSIQQVPSNLPIPTTAIVKNDSILTEAQRESGKDYSISEVGQMIRWNGKPIRRQVFVGWLHENGFLCIRPECADYPTEYALTCGYFTVLDRCKRGTHRKLVKPRVRVTMDGCNYFIEALKQGMKNNIRN